MYQSVRQRLQEYEQIVEPIIQSEEKSRQLQAVVPHSTLYIALCNTTLECTDYELIQDLVTIRAVTNPPGIVHMATASKHHTPDYLAISRHSHAIRCELAVGVPELDSDIDMLINIAWHVVALLKLRGCSNVFSPACSNVSWDVVAAAPKNSVIFHLLDDYPDSSQPSRKIPVRDLEWISKNWVTSLELRDREKYRRFGLAYNISYSWNHSRDSRAKLASIWCGLEALFGDQRDTKVTDALVQRIHAWIPDVPKRHIRQLYRWRCDAVHGRAFDEDKVTSIIKESELLLSRSLIRCIESSAVPLPDWK